VQKNHPLYFYCVYSQVQKSFNKPFKQTIEYFFYKVEIKKSKMGTKLQDFLQRISS